MRALLIALVASAAARPTATSNRKCDDLTFCSTTEYETRAPSRFENRVCQAHRVCSSTEWETVAAGRFNDRTCQPHTVCWIFP